MKDISLILKYIIMCLFINKYIMNELLMYFIILMNYTLCFFFLNFWKYYKNERSNFYFGSFYLFDKGIYSYNNVYSSSFYYIDIIQNKLQKKY